MLSLVVGILLAGAPLRPPAEIHRLVVAPGDTIVAHEQGEGATIVLVPGLLGNAFGFRNLAPRLADAGYHTLIIEPLGTGNSARPKKGDYTLEAQAKRVAAVLDQLGVEHAHFVCHSVGASICMRLALQQPARVRGIVSLNGGPDERAATSGLRSSLKFAPLLKLFGAGRILRGKVVDGLRNNSADPKWVTDEVIRGYTAPFRDLGVALNTLKAMSNAVEPDSLRPRLPQLDAPVLMLLGVSSPSGAPKPEDVAALRALPRLDTDTIPDAGQYLHEEQPALVTDAIVRFVRKNP